VLGWPVLLDVVRLVAVEDGIEATVMLPSGACQMPVTTPCVVAIASGSAVPRYPHPARIANAWQQGVVEVRTPADLNLPANSGVPETEISGLILSPERSRGRVIGGSPPEAAKELLSILHAGRLL
jgi:electron transfer flavoprotein alpha/beta subunit